MFRCFTIIVRRRRLRRLMPLEHQSLPIFLGEYPQHRLDRNEHIERDAAKAPRTRYCLVGYFKVSNCTRTKIEHNLAIFDMRRRNNGIRVDPDSKIGSQSAIHAPLVDRTDQIRARGNVAHLRMALSDAVSASMKPCLENSRSAYFISGAASFPSCIP